MEAQHCGATEATSAAGAPAAALAARQAMSSSTDCCVISTHSADVMHPEHARQSFSVILAVCGAEACPSAPACGAAWDV